MYCQMKAKQDYLPKEKLEKYLNVNPSSSLSSLVPRGMTEDELTMELTDKFTSVSFWSTSGIQTVEPPHTGISLIRTVSYVPTLLSYISSKKETSIK